MYVNSKFEKLIESNAFKTEMKELKVTVQENKVRIIQSQQFLEAELPPLKERQMQHFANLDDLEGKLTFQSKRDSQNAAEKTYSKLSFKSKRDSQNAMERTYGQSQKMNDLARQVDEHKQSTEAQLCEIEARFERLQHILWENLDGSIAKLYLK